MSQLHCCKLAIFENAAEGHTCEVVTHANQESLSGNSSAIFKTMHTCITLCNQSVPGTKPHENNEPNISLPAKCCLQNAAGRHAKLQWHLAHFLTGRPICILHRSTESASLTVDLVNTAWLYNDR